MSTSHYTLVGPFKQLLTMEDIPLKGALADHTLPVIEDGGIMLHRDRIYKVGSYVDLLEEAEAKQAEIHVLDSDYVGMPGFIDAHTHICFAGSRSNDYAMRNAGKSYLEIAKQGGGIWNTVTHTRKASQDELEEGIIRRAERHLSEGVTTIEVKSGYGLTVDCELKMLRSIANTNKNHVIDLIPTCLAAHIKPKDFDGDEKEYLDHIIQELLPIVQQEKLSRRVDIFIEETAFSVELATSFLEQAQALGFNVTVHADQFSTGGSEVAIHVDAMSADHLEASTDKEIELLSKSNVIPIALPGASMGLGCPFTPARKLLDSGCSLVIASDWNPGSAPMGDLLMQASILGTYEKLSNAEILSALTFRAAAALGLNDRGVLSNDKLGDIIAFPCSHYNEVLYQQGKLKPSMIWKRGVQVCQ